MMYHNLTLRRIGRFDKMLQTDKYKHFSIVGRKKPHFVLLHCIFSLCFHNEICVIILRIITTKVQNRKQTNKETIGAIFYLLLLTKCDLRHLFITNIVFSFQQS